MEKNHVPNKIKAEKIVRRIKRRSASSTKQIRQIVPMLSGYLLYGVSAELPAVAQTSQILWWI